MTISTRIMRFALVGTLCFFVQWSILHALEEDMRIFYADIIAFMLSAQLNFTLSCVLTWSDRQDTPITRRWLDFNTSALCAVGINAAMLSILISIGAWQWMSLLIANLASTVFSFTVNHFIVFRKGSNERSNELGVFPASP